MKRVLILVIIATLCFVAQAIDTSDTQAMIKLYQHPNCESEKELKQLALAADKIRARVKNQPGAEEINKVIERYELFYEHGELISFASSKDRGVVKLKSEFGLTPPPGYALVFVSGFLSAMEESDGSTRYGVTLGDRFIVLADPSATIISAEPKKPTTQMPSFSHEMVHAFMNSYIYERGVKNNLPKWFDEGCATFISGESESKTVAKGYDAGKGQVEVSANMTEEYKKYKLSMEYLSTVYPEEKFRAFIRQSIDNGSCDKPLTDLIGTSNEKILFKKASNWSGLRTVFSFCCIVWVVIVYFFSQPVFQKRNSCRRAKKY